MPFVGGGPWWQARAKGDPHERRLVSQELKKTATTYLGPKEVSQARPIACFDAPMEQADKHDEKQDYVGGEHDNGIKSGDRWVGYRTHVCYRQPYPSDLWVEVSFGSPK